MSISAIAGSSLLQTTQLDPAAMKHLAVEWMANQLDGDADGAISKDEFITATEKFLAQMDAESGRTTDSGQLFSDVDTSGDEWVSRDELVALVDHIAAAVAGASIGTGDHAPPEVPGPGEIGEPPAAGEPQPAGAEHVADAALATSRVESPPVTSDPADTNGDGAVSSVEQLLYSLQHPADNYLQVATARAEEFRSLMNLTA